MKRVHFIGIKGVGMSALAIVAHGLGYKVTGSDVPEAYGPTGELLKEAGITTFDGFDAAHITGNIDTVVVGTAFSQTNPEIAAAQERRIPLVTYAKFLGELSKQKKTVAIAGTHGKTTTTSLTAYLIYHAGRKPSWVIGTGHISGLPSHGFSGEGEYFITEADDYKISAEDTRPKFAELSPAIAVITSIEHDHPDVYPTLEACVQAFRLLVQRVPQDGLLIVNGDDPVIHRLMREFPNKKVITYGFETGNDYRIHDTEKGFMLEHNHGLTGPFQLALPGQHNRYNATVAIIIAQQAGVGVEAIQTLLPKFRTVERRFEILGEYNGAIIVDDYAHHPTAVAMTLEAAKRSYPDRPLWVAFQSHTFSRTETLLKEFSRSFEAADTVVITDIFGSARESTGSITGKTLANTTAEHHDDVRFVAFDELLGYLKEHLPNDAVLITMGAGNIYEIGKALAGATQ